MSSTRSSGKRKFDALEDPADQNTATSFASSIAQFADSAFMPGDLSASAAVSYPGGNQGAENDQPTSPTSGSFESDQHSEYESTSTPAPTASAAAASGDVPATSSNQTATTQKVDGVGNLETLHGPETHKMDAGHENYYRLRRKLEIADDDFAKLEKDRVIYVEIVYGRLTTNPISMTEEQNNQAALYAKKLKKLGEDADQHLADVSSMIVAAIIRLHKKGDYFYRSQFKDLKPCKEDSIMKAMDRFEIVGRYLHNNKKHAIDLMEGGADSIAKFVAAPKGAARRKKSYKENNDQRAAKFKELTGKAGKNEEGAEATAGSAEPTEESKVADDA